MTDYCLITTCPCHRFTIGDQVHEVCRGAESCFHTVSAITHDPERAHATVWRDILPGTVEHMFMGGGMLGIDTDNATVLRDDSK
jgi:hypothetical protein